MSVYALRHTGQPFTILAMFGKSNNINNYLQAYRLARGMCNVLQAQVYSTHFETHMVAREIWVMCDRPNNINIYLLTFTD